MFELLFDVRLWVLLFSEMLILLLTLLLVPWSLNPCLIPALQTRFLRLVYRPFWNLRVALSFIDPPIRTATAAIGCHKLLVSSSNTEKSVYDMKLVLERISLPNRSKRSFYFFAGFVYPLLPLDLTGNQSATWNRINACFSYVLNYRKILTRCNSVAHRHAVKLAEQISVTSRTGLTVCDEKIRYAICSMMWELVFDCEPSEPDLSLIIDLTESISQCFTFNLDPDWSDRMKTCKKLMQLFRSYPDMVSLENEFKLTTQEMCTVIGMEFFVTPALEIGEVMSNMMTELARASQELKKNISSDPQLMKYTILLVAHRYPVLQAIFREVNNEKLDSYVTDCFNWFKIEHTLEIQTQTIAQTLEHDSIIDHLQRFSADQQEISDEQTCMAFGRGPRACKGKELAIKVITMFLSTLFDELNEWPIIEISSGRKCTPFRSRDERLFHFNQRCWIADVQYIVDQFFQRSELERFRCLF